MDQLNKLKKCKCEPFTNNFDTGIESIQQVNSKWNSIIDNLNETDNLVMNELQVKTRLTEINEEASREKNKTIMQILSSLSVSFIFVFAVVGYLSGKISITTMITLFIVGTIIGIILALAINKYTIKEFKNMSDALKSVITKKGDELNTQASDWANNCNCPEN